MRQLIRAQVVPEARQARARCPARPELAVKVASARRPQAGHDVECFEGHPAVHAAGGWQAEQVVVGGQGADADAQLVAAPGQVVEVGDAVRQLDRMVVGQQMAERAEPDPRGPLQGLGNEEVRCRAGLPGGGEVLADPCLVEAERIQPLDDADRGLSLPRLGSSGSMFWPGRIIVPVCGLCRQARAQETRSSLRMSTSLSKT